MPNQTEVTLALDFTPYLSRTERTLDSEGPYQHPVTVEELVLDAAVAQLVRGIGADERRDLRGRAQKITNDVIREQVEPIVRAAIEQPFQPTDTFGNARGEPTSLHEMVLDVATKILTQRKQSTGRDPQRSFVEQVVHDQVTKALGAELTAAIEQAKAEVAAAVKDAAAGAIAQAITRAIK